MPTFYFVSTSSSTRIPKQSGPFNYAIHSTQTPVNREPSTGQIKPKNKGKNKGNYRAINQDTLSMKWDNDGSRWRRKTPSKISESPLIDTPNIPPTNEQPSLVDPNITERGHGRPNMEKLSILLLTLSTTVLGVLTITIKPEEWVGFTQVAVGVAIACSLIGGVSFVFLQLSFYLLYVM
jgi:hypothetical protein